MKKTLLTLLAAVGLCASAVAQETGSAENPLTVDQLLDQGTPTTPVANTFVKGYIVGYVPGMTWSEAVLGELPPADAQKSNIVIAGSSGEDMLDYCIPVALPAGDVRNALNLVDNPANLGRQVTLCGSHEKYFGVNGMKSISAYVFDGGQLEVLPTTVTYLSEDFATIPANWTNLGTKNFYATAYQGKSYAAMTGYNGTAPFDSWLISPAVEIAKCDKKVLTFETQVNGYGSTTTEFKAYILNSNDPTKATVKDVINCTFATPVESGYSGWVASGDIDLSKYTGEIYLGFNYTATEDANYATWCVTSVRLNADSAPVTPPSGDKGSASAPLSVSDMLAKTAPAANSGEAGWYVKGVIVGYIPDKSASSAIFGPASADAQKTNIVIADNADVKDIAKCLPIQLPTGSVREGLNLVDNPGNLYKEVVLCGTFEKYFGQNGLKSVVSFSFDGETPEEPKDKAIFSSLATEANGWSEVLNEPLAEGMSYVWKWDTSYKNYKASSYVSGVDNPADATAVSPVVDLTGYSDLTLSFAHAGKFFSSLEAAREEALVEIREVGGEWQALEIPNMFSNETWTFVDNVIGLDDFAGKKVEFGLHYICTGKAGTWEVKNFAVKGVDGSGVAENLFTPFEIRVVNGSIIAPADAEIYNASGMRSNRENLQKGIYLVRSGNRVAKVLVK